MPDLAANINLKAKAPLDSRLVKDTVDELADLLEYEGLEVWVRSEKKKYRYNGVNWEEVTSGGDNSRELTKAEYDALSDVEKNNGTTYYITDEGGDNDILDDTEASTSKTYSSNKIEAIVSNVSQKVDGVLDDTTKSTDSTYSSQQIETMVGGVSDSLNELINDTTASATSTYSSNKIDSLVGGIKLDDYMKKEELENGTLEKIGMYDDFDITSDGSKVRMGYSDTEICMSGSVIDLHNNAGGESRIKLDDGKLTLEGSPYWHNNAKVTLTSNGEDGDSSATVEANDINLKGTVNVNGAPLFAPVTIIGATPADSNIRGLTAKELWDNGLRSGTYLVECHEQTSMSQGFFVGFLDLYHNGGVYELNDCNFYRLAGSSDTLTHTSNGGVDYLTYQGNHDHQDGRPVSMTFVKLNSYTDN